MHPACFSRKTLVWLYGRSKAGRDAETLANIRVSKCTCKQSAHAMDHNGRPGVSEFRRRGTCRYGLAAGCLSVFRV